MVICAVLVSLRLFIFPALAQAFPCGKGTELSLRVFGLKKDINCLKQTSMKNPHLLNKQIRNLFFAEKINLLMANSSTDCIYKSPVVSSILWE